MVQGQQRGSWLHPVEDVAGSSTSTNASLGRIANISINARVAAVPMACPVSTVENEELGKLTRRGVTPVKMERMLPYLTEYPNREAAAFLESDFRVGFGYSVNRIHNLASVLIRPEVVANKIAKASAEFMFFSVRLSPENRAQ